MSITLPLGAAPAWWPADMFGPWRLDSVFAVLHHVTVETATHAGHLDAARELLDGRTWDYELGRLSETLRGCRHGHHRLNGFEECGRVGYPSNEELDHQQRGVVVASR